MSERRTRTIVTIRDRVVATVKTWCGFGGFDTSISLAVLWGQSSQADSIPFKPQAVSDLISKLQCEFRPPKPDPRDLSAWNPNSFAPGGTIDTVDALCSAVALLHVKPAVHAVAAKAKPKKTTAKNTASKGSGK